MFAKKRQCHAVALTLSLPAGPVKPISPGVRHPFRFPFTFFRRSLKSCPRARTRSTGSRFLRKSRRRKSSPTYYSLAVSTQLSLYRLSGRCKMRGARAEKKAGISRARSSSILHSFSLFLFSLFSFHKIVIFS